MYAQQAPLQLAIGGSANTLTASVPNISNLDNIKNVMLSIIVAATNTGNATMNVNGYGQQTIKKPTIFGMQPLTGGELVQGCHAFLMWDGFQFAIVGPVIPPIPSPDSGPTISHGAGSDRRIGANSLIVPANVYWINIAVVGGGGGADLYQGAQLSQDVEGTSGGGTIGRFNMMLGTGSGGGGGVASGWFSVNPGDTLTYNIGDGGGPGQNGGDSSYSFMTGRGGRCGSGASPGAGGDGVGGQWNFRGCDGSSGIYAPQSAGNSNIVIAGGPTYFSNVGQGASSKMDPIFTPRGSVGGIFWWY